MRIQLDYGKQEELILLAKKDGTWKELAEKLDVNMNYLCNELSKESRSLSEQTYMRLCTLIGRDYNLFIKSKLEDNWGKSKGGLNSSGSRIKPFKAPNLSENLAELCGIILGDGHLEYYQDGKKIRSYGLTVTGHSLEDLNFLKKHVNNLIKQLFDYSSRYKGSSTKQAIYLIVNGKKLVEFFTEIGIKSGNKKTHNQGIPNWILDNENYLKACLRGLIDTDGSIHYISKNNRNLRICFTSYIPKLIDDVRNAFLKLGFHPSKIIKCNQIFLTRKENIQRYIDTIGFNNDKHLNRIKRFYEQKALVE